MKTGYTVTHQGFGRSDNAILVHNFCTMNEVWITPCRMKSIGGFCKDNAVGVWTSKCIHDWKTNISKQYEECKKCGKGHAL